MNIVLVNTYASRGGASVAAGRLNAALRDIGVQSSLLVQDAEGLRHPGLSTTGDRWAARRALLDVLPALAWRTRRSPHWGNAWIGNRSTRNTLNRLAPDIIHLHWINHGMLSITDIARLNRPIVWTLHDAWAFTGGCHTPQGCDRFKRGCGHCPELNSTRTHDISRWNWARKLRAWKTIDLTVVTPSRWLARMAQRSPLMAGRRIEVIPNAIDRTLFQPRDRAAARAALGLPTDGLSFLFAAHGAATDWNKGMDLWQSALPVVAAQRPGVRALIAGMAPGALGATCLPVHELGVLPPDRMALAMAAANVLVVPSRTENLPNVIAESLACGTPIAAFATGGIPEMIAAGVTGYLARPDDPTDLAQGICHWLDRGDATREVCIKYAESYAPEYIARRHVSLYDEVCTDS